jgi:hypothetical protein
MFFKTEVNGIPCTCAVHSYSPAEPMRITGMGFGDCDPPIPEEFDYTLLDGDGIEIPELDEVSDEDTESLIQEYKALSEREQSEGYISDHLTY